MYCFKYIKEDPYNPKGVGLVSSHYTQSPYELTTGIDIANYVLDRFKKVLRLFVLHKNMGGQFALPIFIIQLQ